jgi:endonuclease/exonuclease/phosphatase family metal-dependent hydrolase
MGGFGFGATIQYKEWFPLRIDYIYNTPSVLVERAEVPDLGCSDHLPVLSVLRVVD